MRPRHVKVDKLTKRVSQTDYLQMLDEAMKFARVQESKPMLQVRELPIRLGDELARYAHTKEGVQDAD
jgi:hypothetical protein